MKTNNMIILAACTVLMSSCLIEKRTAENTLTKEIVVEQPFTKLNLRGAYDVEFTQDSIYSLSVRGTEQQVNALQTSYDGDMLILWNQEESKNKKVADLFRESKNMKVKLTAPDLNQVVAAGACDFDADQPLTLRNIEFWVAGAGDIDIKHLTCDTVKVNVAGAGDVDLGLHKVGYTLVELKGAGDADIDFDNCGDVDCTVRGAGDIDLSGTVRSLKKKVGGAGDISTKKLTITGK